MSTITPAFPATNPKQNIEARNFAHIEAELEAEFWQESALGRHHSITIRVGFSVVLAIFCGLLGIDYWICALWLIGTNLAQAHDYLHAKRFVKHLEDIACRRKFVFSLAVSCIFYSAIVPIGWFGGGLGLKIIMILFTAGALVSNGIRAQKIPEISIAIMGPYGVVVLTILFGEAIFARSFGSLETVAIVSLILVGAIYIVSSVKFSAINTEALKHSLIENRLRRQTADQANQAKSEFLATMSHEMRTPLNAIMGSATLLKNAVNGKSEVELLHTLEDAGNSLLELLNNLLDLSKIEAGRMDFETVAFSPVELVEGVRNLWANSMAEKGVALGVEFDSETDAALLGDPSRIRQIINNLMSNAHKFTEKGSVSIKVETWPDAILISVKDTGIGVSKEAQELIFDPYKQANIRIAGKFGGTGLGLSTSRKLAKLMGGDLYMESEYGIGSTFTLRVARKIADASDLPNNADEIDLDTQTQRNDMRVLVADDNYSNRLILSRFLEIAGIQSIMANDGKEALELASQSQFDIILLDVRMPVMDGLTACRAIRKLGNQNAKTPIIMVSADAAKSQIALGMEAGASGYLTKPINPQKLFAAIESAANGTEPQTPSDDISRLKA